MRKEDPRDAHGVGARRGPADGIHGDSSSAAARGRRMDTCDVIVNERADGTSPATTLCDARMFRIGDGPPDTAPPGERSGAVDVLDACDHRLDGVAVVREALVLSRDRERCA